MPFSRKFVESHSYLFIIDPSLLLSSANKQLVAYEKEEPGYTNGILKGYQCAFDPKILNPMSHQVLQAIHQAAMAHDPKTTPGQYKKMGNHFSIYARPLNNPQICTQNASIQGFYEFLASSLLIENPLHGVTFSCPKNDLSITLQHSFSLEALNGPLRVHSVHHAFIESGLSDVFGDDPIPAPLSYDPLRDNSRIEQALQMSSNAVVLETVRQEKELFFINSINSMTDNIPEGKHNETIIRELDNIFASYAQARENAVSTEDKLVAIVLHIQRIQQLHPFEDGNTRTTAILLNRLLKEESLNLTMLFNPNRLDCFSVKENVEFVKQGQKFCEELVNGKVPSFETDPCYADARKAGLKAQNINPSSLVGDDNSISDFLNLLQCEQQWLKLQRPYSQKEFDSASPRFFASAANESSCSVDSLVSDITIYSQIKPISERKGYQGVIVAIQKGELELAFRKASAGHDVYVVLLLLNYVKAHKDKLVFNVHAPSPSSGKSALALLRESPGCLLAKKEIVRAVEMFLSQDSCLSSQPLSASP